MNSAEMDIQRVTEVVTALYQSRLKARNDVSLCEGMEFYYRSAFLAWLMESSTPEQRSLARKFALEYHREDKVKARRPS